MIKHYSSVHLYDVSDTSDGVAVNQRATLNVQCDSHGRHGVFENQNDSNSNLNRADINISVSRSGSDGYRIENTSAGAINITAGWRRVLKCFDNTNIGVNVVDAEGLLLNIAIANQNGGYGFALGGDQCILNAGRLENNNGSNTDVAEVSGSENILNVVTKGRVARPNFPSRLPTLPTDLIEPGFSPGRAKTVVSCPVIERAEHGFGRGLRFACYYRSRIRVVGVA